MRYTTTDCITTLIKEQININKTFDLSKCEDDRDIVKFGDVVAILWFNDPKYYAGTLENIGGKLGFPIGNSIVGFVEDAHHVILISKSIDKEYIYNEFIKDIKNIISVIEKTNVDIDMKVEFFRLFFEGWQLGKETALLSVGIKPSDLWDAVKNQLSSILYSVELGEYTPTEGWYQLTNITLNV